MAETAYVPRLRTQYEDAIKADLMKQFGYTNVMQLPKLDKIVLNMGVGEAVNDTKKVKAAAADLERSPARSRSSRTPASRSPASRCARTCRSA